MAPPVTIPANPEGANGVQLAGLMSIPPTTRNVRIGARPLSRRPHRTGPLVGQIDAESRKLSLGVSAEADRDRNIAHDVFKNQIPTDDPGENLAQRGVRIRVGAARDRDHGG